MQPDDTQESEQVVYRRRTVIAGTAAVAAGCSTTARPTTSPTPSVRVEGLSKSDALIRDVELATANNAIEAKIMFIESPESWYDTLEVEREDGSTHTMNAEPKGAPFTNLYVGSRGDSWAVRLVHSGDVVADFRIEREVR